MNLWKTPKKSVRVVEGIPSPAALSVTPSHVRVGDGYAATYVVCGYPAEVGPAWLDPLLSYPGRVDVAVHLDPVVPQLAAPMLKRQRARLESSRRLDARQVRPAAYGDCGVLGRPRHARASRARGTKRHAAAAAGPARAGPRSAGGAHGGARVTHADARARTDGGDPGASAARSDAATLRPRGARTAGCVDQAGRPGARGAAGAAPAVPSRRVVGKGRTVRSARCRGPRLPSPSRQRYSRKRGRER